MAPISSALPSLSDALDITTQSIHTTVQQFKEQSPQLFWLAVCVFSFSFVLTVLYIGHKLVMILWKGPGWNDDPRLVPPPKKLNNSLSRRLVNRADSCLSRSETEKLKRTLQEVDKQLQVIPVAVEEPTRITMSRRSWTQCLLARTYVSNQQIITAPEPCLVKGTGVACTSAPKATHSAEESVHDDEKRSSSASSASAYSQDSADGTPTSVPNSALPSSSDPDDSVPSIIIQPCSSPPRPSSSSSSSLSLSSPSPIPPPPASPSPPTRRSSRKSEYLQVPPPGTVPSSTRTTCTARVPSFASSRRVSKKSAPPSRKAMDQASSVGRAGGKENARGRAGEQKAGEGKAGGEKRQRKDMGFAAPRAPLATKGRAGDVFASPGWKF